MKQPPFIDQDISELVFYQLKVKQLSGRLPDGYPFRTIREAVTWNKFGSVKKDSWLLSIVTTTNSEEVDITVVQVAEVNRSGRGLRFYGMDKWHYLGYPDSDSEGVFYRLLELYQPGMAFLQEN